MLSTRHRWIVAFLRASLVAPPMGLTEAPTEVEWETFRQLAAAFSTAARLYAETVAALTAGADKMLGNDYDQSLKAAKEAQTRAHAAGISFEEYVASSLRTSRTLAVTSRYLPSPAKIISSRDRRHQPRRTDLFVQKSERSA